MEGSSYKPAIADAMKPNLSAHSDIQQKVAALRRLLRAGGLQR
jgi:hypothetical protein